MTRTRRALLALAAPLALLANAGAAVAAVIHVVKSPTCACCNHWIEYLRSAGFEVTVVDAATGPEAKRLGVPDALRGCHTASTGRYALEGHVPAEDIARLLREQPDAAGLAVPGMPSGAPGMHLSGKQPFQTFLFTRDGKTQIFANH